MRCLYLEVSITFLLSTEHYRTNYVSLVTVLLGVTNCCSGWRKDVVNRCLTFRDNRRRYANLKRTKSGALTFSGDIKNTEVFRFGIPVQNSAQNYTIAME